MKLGLSYINQLATAMAASKPAAASSSTDVNTADGSGTAQRDRVTISRIGLDKSKQTQATAAEKPTDPVEASIEKLKERIEEIKEELRKLQNDDSEAGEQRRRQLQSELQQLNMTLLQMMERKLQAEKQQKA